jgi:hypothetical protein
VVTRRANATPLFKPGPSTPPSQSPARP